MIISCRIGDIESMIDTEDGSYVPEVATDLLNRAAQSVVTMFLAMPDAPDPVGD